MAARIVLDTSVLLAGLRSRNGPNNALLQQVAQGTIRMLCTPPLFLEYEDLLKRPEQRAIHGLQASEIDEFLAGMAAVIQPVDIHFHWRPQMNDPDDEMVLEAAINGYADAIATNNSRDFLGPAEGFSIQVISPGQMLRKVRP